MGADNSFYVKSIATWALTFLEYIILVLASVGVVYKETFQPCSVVVILSCYLSSASKITGHIMAVDGGKSLTSRGQQDWYGWQYMSRKFEQESTSYYNYRMY